jgi:hypothetical protein
MKEIVAKSNSKIISVEDVCFSKNKIYVLHNKQEDKIGIYSECGVEKRFYMLGEATNGWTFQPDNSFKSILTIFADSKFINLYEFEDRKDFAKWLVTVV